MLKNENVDQNSIENLPDISRTLKELAKITGIRQYKLRKILNGKRIPTMKILQKIAKGLGKTVKVQII